VARKCSTAVVATAAVLTLSAPRQTYASWKDFPRVSSRMADVVAKTTYQTALLY